jgi:diaminopimelate epimerase
MSKLIQRPKAQAAQGLVTHSLVGPSLAYLGHRAARLGLSEVEIDVGETFENRFLLVWHESERGFDDPDQLLFWRGFARLMCNHGPRVDDTLHVVPRAAATDKPSADFWVIGGDGRVASHCANGLIYAGHRYAERWETSGVEFHCGPDRRAVNVRDDAAQVNLGRPTLLPCLATRWSSLVRAPIALNTGEPHAVSFVEDLAIQEPPYHDPFLEIGPAICHAAGPSGINWNLVDVCAQGLHIRTFERGVRRPTSSCGTGSAAAFFAARRAGHWRDDEAAVFSAGGCHEVACHAGELLVTGRPTHEHTLSLGEFLGQVAAK